MDTTTQSFADELAHTAGRDPLEYLLELIGPPRILNLKDTNYPNYGAAYDAYPVDTGRLRRVTEMVAEKAEWGKRKLGKGSGLGIAAHRSFLTYVASVVEVAVNEQGELSIPRVDTVVDAGTVANPEITRAQFEGAAVFGTSIVRSGEITATKGVINSNVFDYPVARINEAFYQTDGYLVDSTAPPAGVGEPGVPPFMPHFVMLCMSPRANGSGNCHCQERNWTDRGREPKLAVHCETELHTFCETIFHASSIEGSQPAAEYIAGG